MPNATLTIPVLFKLKPGVSPEQIAELKAAATGMVGQIPGQYNHAPTRTSS